MRSLLKGAIIASILALSINGVIFLVASSSYFNDSLGVSWEVGPPVGTVTLGTVLIATLVSVLGATFLLFLLKSFTKRPVNWFLWIALIVGMLSMIGPYQSAANRASIVALGLLHVGAAIGIVWGFLYSLRGDNFDNTA